MRSRTGSTTRWRPVWPRARCTATTGRCGGCCRWRSRRNASWPTRANGFRRPGVPHREMVFLDWPDAVELAEAHGERYRAFIYLAVDSGMRWSELVGLRRAKLDMRARKGPGHRATGPAPDGGVAAQGAEDGCPRSARSRSRRSPPNCWPAISRPLPTLV